MKVWLIEDDHIIRLMVETYLAQEGHNVLATDRIPDDAMLEMQSLKPDVILCDVMIPGKNGFELCRELSTAEHAPIVLMTAGNFISSALAIQWQADAFVRKPFDLERLTALLTYFAKAGWHA